MNRHLHPTSPRDVEAVAARWIARRDAGLSPAEETELLQWIEADPSHRSALAFYGAAWSTLAQPAQNGAAEILEQQLEKLSRRRAQRRTLVAASLALLLLTGGIVRWNLTDRASPFPSTSALVHVPSRQTLPDGSVVELKDNARIAVDYTVNARRIALLAGEAHFVVEQDSARPFVVSVSGVEVRAVGTAFSVHKGPAAVEVLVTHGKVAVERLVAMSVGPAASLEPLAAVEAGNLVVVEIAGKNFAPLSRPVPSLELDQRLAWRSPRLEFTRTPLAEAVALFNQHAGPAGPQLAVSDPTIAALRISGVFRADNIDAFVLLLEGVFEVKAERTGGTIVLQPKR
jgi:transmembrane sensor